MSIQYIALNFSPDSPDVPRLDDHFVDVTEMVTIGSGAERPGKTVLLPRYACYPAVHFKLDYVNAKGDISNYYPDFLVKLPNKRIFIVETKGQEDLDVPLKMHRLRQWCEEINRVQADVRYDFVYVDQESFERYKPTSFQKLVDGFREYKEQS